MKTIRPKYKIITKKKVSKQHRGNISNLVLLEKIIFKLNYENIEESVHSIFELFGTKNKYTIFNVVCQLVYSSFVSQMKDFDMYLMFLKSLEEKYRKKNIINVLVRFLLFLETHEAIYLLEQLYEKGLIGINILLKKKTLYFINYASDKNYFKNKPIYFYRKFDENCFVYYEKNSWNLIYKKIKDNFDNHLEELSRNDWELHKQLIKEGHNPNEIAKIIRNDDIEKLQEMSSQNDFDFNQKIEPSLYERCSFINQENVSLIDYAAFFSAIKCFKYLLMNNAKVNNAGKYAVAGGNEEIIYLCEQNHSVFEDAYEAAIEFHRNDIFKYLYENELDEIDRTFNFYYGFYERKNIQFKKSYILGVKCVLSSSYELLSFLIKKNYLQIKDLINVLSATGNLFLIKSTNKKFKVPENFFILCEMSGNVELVKYVIKNFNVDVNEIGINDNTPIIYASKHFNYEIVKLLLKQKGILYNATNRNKHNALMKATKNNDIKMVKLLLKKDSIDINAKNEKKFTVLMTAAEKGQTKLMELFLNYYMTDINDTDKLGKTALIIAAANGQVNAVELLLEHEGTEINAKDINGRTAIIYAAIYGREEVMKLLVEHEEVDINYHDFFGKTPLMYAAEKGHIETVKFLLKQKHIKINDKTQDGETALMLACSNGHKEIVQLLLNKRGINIGAKNDLEETALMYALQKNYTEIAELFPRQCVIQ